jgi:cytochrome c biogenesis protein CcdA/thiol-disulfide isomerase/thioredoxin
MFLLFGAFIAGIVTVFAPCVLPLLPIIIGGSVSGSDGGSKRRPFIIAASLAISLTVFTLLLKATTLLIDIPPRSISYISGGVIILIGVLSLYPVLYEKVIARLGFQSRSQRLLGKGTLKKGDVGAVITGAALGPVFSSCSPVYAYILATILPVNFFQAIVYILAYVLGLSVTLLLIGILGQRFVKRIRFVSNPKGWFQRAIAILFIIVGLLVLTGFDKRAQTWVSSHTPFDFDGLSSKLIPASNRESQSGVLNVRAYQAPEFSDDLTEWINTEPIALDDLKGKVVLLDFWTYSCINCIRTQPYLRGWYDTYKDSGFEIIGMHAPEFAFEKLPSNVEKAVKDAKLTYPVALDNNFSTWNAYGNQYWPGTYLIDKSGKVRRIHAGEGEYKQTEQAIRLLLQENGGSVPEKMFVSGTSSVPASAAQSPETYLGSRRATNYVGTPALLIDQTQRFALPRTLKQNGWGLTGDWRVTRETIVAAGDDSTLQFKIAGKDVYLVAGASSPTQVKVLLNGKPISQSNAAGSDIKDSQVTIGESKLYKLVKYPSVKRGDILQIQAPRGTELNVFTFGS